MAILRGTRIQVHNIANFQKMKGFFMGKLKTDMQKIRRNLTSSEGFG